MNKVYCENCKWYGGFDWGDGKCLKTKRYDDIKVPASPVSPAHTIKSFAKYTQWKIKNINNDCGDHKKKTIWDELFGEFVL